MRKINPANVKSDFSKQLNELLLFYKAGLPSFTPSGKSTFTEHTLLAAAVAWEGFINDLFIAYINVRPAKFSAHIKNALEQQIAGSEKANLIYKKFTTLTIPRHLKKDEIEEIADHVGNNITFSNYDLLERRSGQWHVLADEGKFKALTPAQKATINAIISLRNHIAHRSDRSLAAMNDTTFKGVLNPTGLRRGARKFHLVGAWLKAIPAGKAKTRIEIAIDELLAIGAAL
jgi:hypothetical protein